MFKFTLTLCVAAMTAGLASAQTPDRAFDLATIRPAGAFNAQDLMTGKAALGLAVKDNQVTVRYASLQDLAAMAWEVKPANVKGPEWMGQTRFDVTAQLPEGATGKDVPQMMRSLLRERFKVTAHKESKDADIYALLEAKGGHKMKPSPELAPTPPPDPDRPAPDPSKQTGPAMTVNGERLDINQTANGAGGANVSISGGRNGAQKVSVGPEGNMHMEIERLTMPELAEQLALLLDLPVQDHTGLTGPFQVALDMTMSDMMGMMNKLNAASGGGLLPPEAQARLSQMAAAEPGGAVMGSVSKLGLRVEKQKGSIATLVIDSAEKAPSEN